VKKVKVKKMKMTMMKSPPNQFNLLKLRTTKTRHKSPNRMDLALSGMETTRMMKGLILSMKKKVKMNKP
jgi:hypothetical protein